MHILGDNVAKLFQDVSDVGIVGSQILVGAMHVFVNMLNLMYSNGFIRVIHGILMFCYFSDPSDRMDVYEPLLLQYLCISKMIAVFTVL